MNKNRKGLALLLTGQLCVTSTTWLRHIPGVEGKDFLQGFIGGVGIVMMIFAITRMAKNNHKCLAEE